MATEREQDILRLIAQNPLISQQEIATCCGITRSSVGVHISNLMKKGLIQGKGYILQTGPYAAVVGGATLDIGGRPGQAMIPRDSNPGTIRFSPGGVGRNIAHNLALLGQEVRFLSVFGDDTSGAQLADSCHAAGIDITQSPVIPGGVSAIYLFITSHQGEMELAVSDMAIYEEMTPDYIKARLDIINHAAAVVADTNPPAESLKYLAENCAPPLFVDPVSTAKAKKLRGLLPRIHTLKCNRVEAELLCGLAITDDDTLHAAAKALMAEGLCQLVITLGERGAWCVDAGGGFFLPAYPVAEVVNTTGAGDAFTAALVHGHMQGWPLEKAAKSGLAAAALCIASRETISPNVSPEAIAALTS